MKNVKKTETRELERPNTHFFKDDVDLSRKVGVRSEFKNSYQMFMRELFSFAINDKKTLERFLKTKGVKSEKS